MTKSKTKIEKQLQTKTNPDLIKTIIAAKKNNSWIRIVEILSGPRRRNVAANLDRIDKETKQGDIIVVPGKVLSMGNVSKKIRVVALHFSERAREKLLKEKCELSFIFDEIKKNPKAIGVRILINAKK